MKREPLFVGVKEEGGELRLVVVGGVAFKLRKGFWMALVNIFEKEDLRQYDGEYNPVEFRDTIDIIKKALEDWQG